MTSTVLPIDLRSDTVTRPTAAMQAEMGKLTGGLPFKLPF